MNMTWTEFIGVSEPNAHLSVPINKAQYEEIYLAGMTEAAEIAEQLEIKCGTGIGCKQAILTARDKKEAI